MLFWVSTCCLSSTHIEPNPPKLTGLKWQLVVLGSHQGSDVAAHRSLPLLPVHGLLHLGPFRCDRRTTWSGGLIVPIFCKLLWWWFIGRNRISHQEMYLHKCNKWLYDYMAGFLLYHHRLIMDNLGDFLFENIYWFLLALIFWGVIWVDMTRSLYSHQPVLGDYWFCTGVQRIGPPTISNQLVWWSIRDMVCQLQVMYWFSGAQPWRRYVPWWRPTLRRTKCWPVCRSWEVFACTKYALSIIMSSTWWMTWGVIL